MVFFPVLSSQLVSNSFLQCPVFHRIVSAPPSPAPTTSKTQVLFRESDIWINTLFRQIRIWTVDCEFPRGADQPLGDCREGAMPYVAVL